MKNFDFVSKFKGMVMGEVKSEGHMVDPVSNQCTSFSFNVNLTNHSWDMAERVFDLEKTHEQGGI